MTEAGVIRQSAAYNCAIQPADSAIGSHRVAYHGGIAAAIQLFVVFHSPKRAMTSGSGALLVGGVMAMMDDG